MTHKMLVAGGLAVIVLFALVLPDLADTASRTSDFAHLQEGEDIYEAACAACHGMDGRGNALSSVAFETPLPDFSDCRFNSREQASDWRGIAREGGPVKGFNRMMPAFGDVLTADQIDAVVRHLKGFCTERKWPDGEMNLPKPLVTNKAFLEDEYVYTFRSTVGSPLSMTAAFITEKRLGARHQVELAIPFTVKEVEYVKANGDSATRWGEGIGDITLAYKVGVFDSRKSKSMLSLAAEMFVPTGDEKDDIGKGIFIFEPLIIFSQIIPHVGFFHLQGGAELSTDTDVSGHEAVFRGAFGRSFSRRGIGRLWSPMVEVLGAMPIEKGAEVEWNILPELQVTLSRRRHIRFCAGANIPVSEFEASAIEVMAYLLWDWFDGGFTEGWR